MTGLNFKQMAEKEQVKDLNKLEGDFHKIQGFSYNEEKNTLKKIKEENFAEELVEGLK